MGNGLQNFKTPLLRIDDIMVLYDIDFCMLLGLVKTLLIFMIMQVKKWMIILALNFGHIDRNLIVIKIW